MDDLKYGKITTEKPNNFGEDEPIFLIRAKDLHSMPVLQFYASQHDNTVKGHVKPGTTEPYKESPENIGFVQQLNSAIDLFAEWQKKNETKIPD